MELSFRKRKILHKPRIIAVYLQFDIIHVTNELFLNVQR